MKKRNTRRREKRIRHKKFHVTRITGTKSFGATKRDSRPEKIIHLESSDNLVHSA